MIKKSDIQSLIVTTDREFKHRSINFFNNIAFNSEKITVSSIREASDHLLNNGKLLNILIDGSIFGAKINEDFVTVKALFDKPDLYGILYLPEKMAKPFEHNDHGVKGLAVYPMPFTKNQFNDVYHRRRSGGGDEPAPAASGAAPAPDLKKNVSVTAFEASNHVRDTINMLKTLDTKRDALDQLHQAGQRFNGIVGTFAFFAKLPGYKELRRLAIIIDRISRHYSSNLNLKSIEDAHFKLLLDSAKCAFLLLQTLRDQKPISEEFTTTLEKIEDQFKNSGIKDIENVSQSEINSILENIGK